MIVCKYCGNWNREPTVFCTHCGTRIVKTKSTNLNWLLLVGLLLILVTVFYEAFLWQDFHTRRDITRGRPSASDAFK